MSTTQKTLKTTVFIDYVPAELRENKTWEVVFYSKNPFTDRLQIKRHRVRPLKNKVERRKLARRMCDDINKKLISGWSPFINEESAKNFVKFSDVKKTFINQIAQKVRKKDLSPDTLRSYTSYLNNLECFFIDLGYPSLFMWEFKEALLRSFLEDIYYDRDNSARTHNNYLRFLNTFSKWLQKRKYIANNPTVNITPERESEKVRAYIPIKTRTEIFKQIEKENFSFYVLCLSCFYCLIRRTELTKLLVSDVILTNSIIYIESGKSKNRKSKPVTIPNQLMPHLAYHLKNANNSDYLFSKNNFKPGKQKLDPKKVSDTWATFREKIGFDKKYQWYSLKDTGITNYLELGLPTLTVRNQARHHSITQTEAYIPKQIIKAVTDIKDANITF